MRIRISTGYVSNLLIKGQQLFQSEKDVLYQAKSGSSLWKHIDEIMTRINGQNQNCHPGLHNLAKQRTLDGTGYVEH